MGLNELSDNYSDHVKEVHRVSAMSDERNVFVNKFVKHDKNSALVGVGLTDDRVIKTGEIAKCFIVGTVCVDDLDTKLDELRKLMCEEISCLPTIFTFLSKEGWPILTKQESLLRISHVINEKNIIYIKKQFEKQKIGIMGAGGEPHGFIFIDINIDLRQLREAIDQQLKISQHLKMEYRFVEKNGWPVTQSQESMLSLVDILSNHVVYIQSHLKLEEVPSKPIRPTSVAFSNVNALQENSLTMTGDTVDAETLHPKKSFKFLRPDPQLSIKSRKGSQNRSKGVKNGIDFSQPILISYVRAEGAQYALDLKQKLVHRGFSVYLDVHEIKTGSDWQDSLNFAVTHCFLFIPLITPMYGKTQWTNREVKLADVLGKMIIPVNFTDQWPPACLAIQFASTQYIPWKVQESDHVKGEVYKPSDSRVWKESHVSRVAGLIADCYSDNNCDRGEKVPRRFPSNAKDIMQSKPRTALASKDEGYINYYDEPLEEGKLIVISAHPNQRNLAQEVTKLLENIGHEIWCSTNCQERPDNADPENMSVPNTPKKLPTINEDRVFFNQKDFDAIDCVGDSTKRSVSMYKDLELYGKRPLSRLMSQFSDISQPSTLSQEKLDRLRTFQQQVDKAGVVIVLVSEAYTKSTFSHQQVFYCEHRKRVVLVKCDNGIIPKWFKLLMGNDMIMHSNPQFGVMLKARVKRALNPSSSETPKDAAFEAKINYLVSFVKRNIPLRDVRVYITGSSKLQTRRAEDICRVLGRELAKDSSVSLVTGGFFGAPDITAKAFYDYCENSGQYYADDSSIQHILPIHESEDLSSKANQNPDGSFEVMPYGKTIFMGDSLKERETVVARLLDMCIIIEGGPGVVHEVEEFIWNDRFVIPIRSTGGAAGGKYGIPMKIFELPNGVDMADWAVLSDEEASPDDVSRAVVNIIFCLKKTVASPINTLKNPGFTNHKNRKKKSKKVRTPENLQNDTVPQAEDYCEYPTLRVKDLTFKKRRNWFHRLMQRLRFR